MTKAELNVLEKVFIAEINGRKFQSKSKLVKSLADRGYLAEYTTEYADRFGWMRVDEWILTHLGRWSYCETCTEEPDDEANVIGLKAP